MLLQAKKEFDLDLNSAISVGDETSDIDAGIAAGVGLRTQYDIYSQVAVKNLNSKDLKVNCPGEIAKNFLK